MDTGGAPIVPHDFRLEQVCARLVERLEGARRSHAGDPSRASEEFRRLTEQHLDAVLTELRDLAFLGDPAVHAAFLRKEVLTTFLPRYERLAVAMTDREEKGFGLGPLAEPIGRLGLVVGAGIVAVGLLRWIYVPATWPVLLVLASVPFWPDLLATVENTRYRRRLRSALEDLKLLQGDP